MKKPVWDWNFKIVNPVEYVIDISTKTEKKFFLKIIRASARAHAMFLKLKIQNTDEVFDKAGGEIPWDPNKLNLLKTQLGSIIKDVKMTVGYDGIFLLDIKIEDARIVRVDSSSYMAKIRIVGNYIKKAKAAG